MANLPPTPRQDIYINTDNKTPVDEMVYLFHHLQGLIYVLLSFTLVGCLIFLRDFQEVENVVMFLLGSNAGIITNTYSGRKDK